jgi:hypothetical protein
LQRKEGKEEKFKKRERERREMLIRKTLLSFWCWEFSGRSIVLEYRIP